MAFTRALPFLPALRFLTLDGRGWDAMPPGGLGWPWRGTSIRTLRVTVGLTQLGAWLDAIAGSQLVELELSGGAYGWRVTILRDPIRITLNNGFRRDRFPADLELIAGAIERVPTGQLAELGLATPKEAWTVANRRRMTRALAIHPRVIAKITNYER